MEANTLKLPVGLVVDGTLVKEAPFAVTGGEAEEVYTSKPSGTKLYTWFGEVLAVSLQSLGSKPVVGPFLKTFNKDRRIPSVVRGIQLNDVGTALLQIQRECWQDVIPAQKIQCAVCRMGITADVDLNKIEVTIDPATNYPVVLVHLSRTYEITPENLDSLEQYKGVQFNALQFRPPVLGDAINHEGVSVDEVLFWRNIAFDCLQELVFVQPGGTEEEPTEIQEIVAPGYVQIRGKLLLTKDLSSKDLRSIRAGLTEKLPSAKFYYEDTCGCGKEQIPFFTSVGNFFS